MANTISDMIAVPLLRNHADDMRPKMIKIKHR